MNFKHIFIVTFGRSGSTLLSGILNSIPNVCIRGENSGVLVHLFRAVKAAKQSPSFIISSEDYPTHPWYGASDLDNDRFQQELINSFVKNILHPPKTAATIGFKEIRYVKYFISDEEFFEFLEFLRTSFERPAIIFNIRNVNDTAKSGWWKNNSDSVEVLEGAVWRFREGFQRNSDISYWVEYEKLIADLSIIEEMFNFVGADFDEKNMIRVLEKRHSY